MYVPFADTPPRKGPPVTRRRLSRALLVATAACATIAAAALGATAPVDHAAQAWNVLPPGQAGGVAFTRNSTDQIALYEGLTGLRDNVKAADLSRFFKRETLGIAPGESAVQLERPRAASRSRATGGEFPTSKGRRPRTSPSARGGRRRPTGS